METAVTMAILWMPLLMVMSRNVTWPITACAYKISGWHVLVWWQHDTSTFCGSDVYLPSLFCLSFYLQWRKYVVVLFIQGNCTLIFQD